MAHHLHTLKQGKTTWHLSTNGRDIFQSRQHFTGGVLFPKAVCRNGKIVDPYSRKLFSDAELLAMLSGNEVVTLSLWNAVVQCCHESLAPFFGRRREVRWNPMLG